MPDTQAAARRRVSPYDLAFVESGLEQHFPAIRDEAREVLGEHAPPGQFLQLRNVAALLREALVENDSSVVAQFGPLLHQAYHFWLNGKQIFELDEETLRRLLGPLEAAAAGPLEVPAQSGYLAFERNLLWARIEDDARPEPVDGLFWNVTGDNEAEARLDVLLVLGLVTGRPGFSIADVSAVLDDTSASWSSMDARGAGSADFANVLPGGELQGLYALTTAGEVLKLVARAFAHLTGSPERPIARPDG
jgi:hypothetical protein